MLHCGGSIAARSGKFGPVLCEVSAEEEQCGSLWQLGEKKYDFKQSVLERFLKRAEFFLWHLMGTFVHTLDEAPLLL